MLGGILEVILAGILERILKEVLKTIPKLNQNVLLRGESTQTLFQYTHGEVMTPIRNVEKLEQYKCRAEDKLITYMKYNCILQYIRNILYRYIQYV